MATIDELIKASEDSLAHWIRMRDDTDCEENPNGDGCALCQVCGFCQDCPVYWHTERMDCSGTPWSKAHMAIIKLRDCVGATPELVSTWQDHVDQEVSFLAMIVKKLKAGELMRPTEKED